MAAILATVHAETSRCCIRCGLSRLQARNGLLLRRKAVAFDPAPQRALVMLRGLLGDLLVLQALRTVAADTKHGCCGWNGEACPHSVCSCSATAHRVMLIRKFWFFSAPVFN